MIDKLELLHNVYLAITILTNVVFYYRKLGRRDTTFFLRKRQKKRNRRRRWLCSLAK